jgi:hypothetical protein
MPHQFPSDYAKVCSCLALQLFAVQKLTPRQKEFDLNCLNCQDAQTD